MDLFAADAHELLLNVFGIIYAFHAHLIVDAKNYDATARVCQCNYPLRNLFRIRKFYFEFEESIFAASH
jgi:hypothetical protein